MVQLLGLPVDSVYEEWAHSTDQMPDGPAAISVYMAWASLYEQQLCGPIQVIKCWMGPPPYQYT